MPAKFRRLRNRTVNDIYRDAIRPRAEVTLHDVAQKIVQYARTKHTYRNRTGALQDSTSWTPVERDSRGFHTAVFAGGWANAKYSYDATLRKTTGRRRRQARYGGGRRFSIRRGQGVYVNYAKYVEDNPRFWVLEGAIKHWRHRIAKVLGRNLKSVRIS